MTTLLSKCDALNWLRSPDGSILARVRVMRDAIARDLLIWDCDEQEITSMVRHDAYASSSFAKLVQRASGDHRWSVCERLEAFRLVCLRCARLEREAAGITISKYDYELGPA